MLENENPTSFWHDCLLKRTILLLDSFNGRESYVFVSSFIGQKCCFPALEASVEIKLGLKNNDFPKLKIKKKHLNCDETSLLAIRSCKGSIHMGFEILPV